MSWLKCIEYASSTWLQPELPPQPYEQSHRHSSATSIRQGWGATSLVAEGQWWQLGQGWGFPWWGYMVVSPLPTVWEAFLLTVAEGKGGGSDSDYPGCCWGAGHSAWLAWSGDVLRGGILKWRGAAFKGVFFSRSVSSWTFSAIAWAWGRYFC